VRELADARGRELDRSEPTALRRSRPRTKRGPRRDPSSGRGAREADAPSARRTSRAGDPAGSSVERRLREDRGAAPGGGPRPAVVGGQAQELEEDRAERDEEHSARTSTDRGVGSERLASEKGAHRNKGKQQLSDEGREREATIRPAREDDARPAPARGGAPSTIGRQLAEVGPRRRIGLARLEARGARGRRASRRSSLVRLGGYRAAGKESPDATATLLETTSLREDSRKRRSGGVRSPRAREARPRARQAQALDAGRARGRARGAGSRRYRRARVASRRVWASLGERAPSRARSSGRRAERDALEREPASRRASSRAHEAHAGVQRLEEQRRGGGTQEESTASTPRS